LNGRQHWILEQLRAGVELQRRDIEKRFGIKDKKAKRELSDLVGRGLIVFERTPRPGHYRLVTKEGSGRPTHKVPQHRELQRGLGERVHEAV
jgi:predicted ArsR family transcriptional regulator